MYTVGLFGFNILVAKREDLWEKNLIEVLVSSDVDG